MIHQNGLSLSLENLWRMKYKTIIMRETILVLAFTILSYAQQIYLQNAPITFELQGSTTYMPDTGGALNPGYKLKMGFDKFSWLGIQFMTLTSGSNYDTLILQRSSSASGGVYTCSVQDFYIAAGRPTVLMNDRITSMDKSATSTSNASAFQLSISRTIGNTSGQDWQGGNLVEICFFTADTAFDVSALNKQYTICFGYQLDTYVSTFRGVNLGTMQFQGVDSKVYGGVYGPFLQLQLYWYRPTPTVTNTTNLVLQIGSSVNEAVGSDYFICGAGDYYGTDILSLMSDTDYSGYNDGSCNFRTTSASIQLAYTRDALTFDTFDYQLTSSVYLCLIGSSTSCSTFTIPVLVPSMVVASALQVYERYFIISALSLMAIMFML